MDSLILDMKISTLLQILTAVLFGSLALWLHFSKGEKVVTSYESEEDLSSAPLMAILFGAALSVLVFVGGEWPEILIGHAQGIEFLGQASFYAFSYILGVAVIWSIVFACIHAVIGNFILIYVPSFVGVAVLMLAIICQVFTFFL